MRIALLSPLYEPVPPPKYGGTERVISALANDLVRRGHDVTLFACGGSHTDATLVEAVRRPLRTTMTRAELEYQAPHLHLKMLTDVYASAADFDIIHSHVDIWTLPFTSTSPVPTLLTMHGRLDLDVVRAVLPLYPETPLVSISDSQRTAVDDLDLTWASTCYNGLDLAAYRQAHERTNRPGYLAFIGRITPEKRPDWAIEVARRANMPLKIAAKIDPLDQDYWTDVIEPLVLADPNVDFIGEISEADKPEFLAGAAAMIFPIDWPEPFGLVMIESLAAGTPVVALDNGSVPEVVDHGRTGFICQDLEAMSDAIRNIAEIDRRDCVQASNRFSAQAMTERYLETYRRVVSKHAPTRRQDTRSAAVDLTGDAHIQAPHRRPNKRRQNPAATPTR